MDLLLSPLRSTVNARFQGSDSFNVAAKTAFTIIGAYYGYHATKYIQKVGLKAAVFKLVLSAAKSVPGADAVMAAEKAKVASKMEGMLIPKEVHDEKVKFPTMPENGLSAPDLLALLKRWKKAEESRWNEGQVSGGIYHGGEELTQVLTEAYSYFALTNPLHPDVFPYVRKMESEVISMTVALFNGTARGACGAMTSGGTESILMACKAYRDRAKEKGIEKPELIIAVSAHAAFEKACHYFEIELVRVPVDPITFKLDIAATKAAINKNTVLIVGSAPSFPHGVIDDIPALSALAMEHNIGLHVDCCLGSYLVCMLERIGYKIAPFDFRLPGVSSISCDTHKYGYAPKGSSVVMFSTPELRRHMYFVAPDWTGGIYASPTIAGSRPGGLIAATWAALVHIGSNGYLECGRKIMAAVEQIKAGVKKIDGIKLTCQPDMSVISLQVDSNSSVAQRAPHLNIFKVGEALGNKHWSVNTLQKPGAIHFCVTYMHIKFVDRFLKDLQWAVDEVANNPEKFKSGTAAIYGMTESLPDTSIVSDVAKSFIDTLFKTV